MPTDLTLYAEAIFEKRPEVIVEIGTKFGGSALYFRDVLDSFGLTDSKVVTIDIKAQVETKDPRIEYVIGNSLDKNIIKAIHRLSKDKRTMLIIDGNHDRKHVKWELHKYHDIVTPGQFMVIEDCYIDRGLYGPGEARDWFLKRHSDWVKTDRCAKYLVGVTMGGWLLKQ
jgi:cephalosporin hydroxylase